MKVEQVEIEKIIPYVNNAKIHTDEQIGLIAGSIKEFGFLNPIILSEDNEIIAGHGRFMAAKKLGLKTVPVIRAEDLTPAQIKAYRLADNKLAEMAEWDFTLLNTELEGLEEIGVDLDLIGFDEDERDLIGNKLIPQRLSEKYSDTESGSLAKNFGVPPFSVLDTRQGYWQERKKYWLSYLNEQGESRLFALDDSKINFMKWVNNAVSILDPVLSELMVAWFGKKGGIAFDPFAGDATFGLVSAIKGMAFKGIELRQEQVNENQKRAEILKADSTYFCDDGRNMDKYIKDESVDLVFSCPPYANLEKYSDNQRDLSNMELEQFFEAYTDILQKTYKKLKNNRFAVIVVSEVRGHNKDGSFIGLVPETVRIMEEAGYKYYNELILVNAVGTLSMRAGGYMRAARKVGRVHQNILVFLKGDVKKTMEELGEININMEEDFNESTDF